MTLPVVFTANGPSGYNLTNSLRFRSSASAYLNRTPASASNRRTWTWSGWVKRGTLSTSQRLFNAYSGDENNTTEVGFDATNNIIFSNVISSSQANGFYGQTSAVFRDPSAWYHIVFSVDTTQSTATAALKVYVNGVQQTLGSSSYGGGTNQNTWINDALPHRIGQTAPPNSAYFDGYLAEVNFIDGQALTPSSFGETSSTTSVWIPKKYTGTYGTNGFYLPFTDNSALTTSSNVGLGKDFSGNANYWTTNNISITAGTTYDSMTDVPTLTSATTANYCVLNPLNASSVGTANNGNLQAYSTSGANTGAAGINGTIALPTTGQYYFEVTMSAVANAGLAGIAKLGATQDTNFGAGAYANIYAYTNTSGVAYANNATAYTGSTLTTGDILGVAVDMTNGALYFAKNNTWQNSGVPTSGASKTGAISFTVTNDLLPTCYAWKNSGADALSANFGQRPFAYTPPTGFVALNTFNLPTPTIGATASSQANKYFNAITYTGNGAASSNTTQNITTTFYPDLTWVKGRDSSFFHRLTSTGLTQPNYLSTNSTDAEGSVNDTISALASTYFQVKAAGTGGTNQSGSTYVGWTWNANSGSTVSNTQGSITSTVSANTTAGFSIVTWTGNGASSATIGHGLGVAPSMIIVKNRSATWGWFVYNKFLTNPNTGRLQLNLTNGEIAGGTPGPWNNTAPTSTVFSLGDNTFPEVNGSGNLIVAYCFAPIAGYSAFGSYIGNGSTDGPFVFTGFRPKFVMVKNTIDPNNWILFDTARNTYNIVDLQLYPNTSDAEVSGGSSNGIDFLSNGFKVRSSNNWGNRNGDTIIYACFAENPFKYANAR